MHHTLQCSVAAPGCSNDAQRAAWEGQAAVIGSRQCSRQLTRAHQADDSTNPSQAPTKMAIVTTEFRFDGAAKSKADSKTLSLDCVGVAALMSKQGTYLHNTQPNLGIICPFKLLQGVTQRQIDR